MKTKILLTAFSSFFLLHSTFAFEGRITAALTRGGQVTPLLYTAGTNFLRVEVTGSDRPNPVDIVDRNTGALMLLFPHNRSYVRLKPASENAAMPQRFPHMPGGLPPGVGPQSQPPVAPMAPNSMPPGIGPTNLPGMPPPPLMPATLNTTRVSFSYIVTGGQAPPPPAMPNMPPGGGMPSVPAMPMMPMPGEAIELTALGEKTNLLGFACEKLEIKQRGEVMEIWATDALLPFQPYVQNQPPRFGPRMIEAQWAGLLTAKKLFPLRASLHFENGPERYRFEVQSITPQKLTKEDQKLFQPPDGYFEIQPLPF